ncbi:MAG: hypothetical protein ACE5FO_02980 [Parvularculaceae bacterium]
MLKLTRVVAAAAFAASLAISAQAPSAAQSQSAQGADADVELCQYYLDRYPGYFDNLGECMKRLRTGGVKYCQYLKERGYFDRPRARWKNQGECVSYLRSIGH